MQSDKSLLRAEMKRVRAQLSAAQRAAQDRAIAQAVMAQPAYLRAQTVFCYCSTAEEIDTYALARDALARGKTLCFPRSAAGGRMEAHAVTALGQLRTGRFGISEPEESCPRVAPERIDLCIIPCLAADLRGHRLGYGGGYYDRYLPRTHALRMLLCADDRLLTHIPAEEHDMRCDILITEGRVIYPNEK